MHIICTRQTTTSAPHQSFFYRPDALSDAKPTMSSTKGNYCMQEFRSNGEKEMERENKISYKKKTKMEQ